MTTLGGSRNPSPATVRALGLFLLMLLIPLVGFTLIAVEIAEADRLLIFLFGVFLPRFNDVGGLP